MLKEITKCRICSNENIVDLLDLGEQQLTGVFPSSVEEKITSGPLQLVKCHPKKNNTEVCGLVQLRHSYDSNEMYGNNYGYRSGLNSSMVRHLNGIVESVVKKIELKDGDQIIDIGGNDSTLLRAYPENLHLKLTVIDPTGSKFKKHYPDYIELIPDFFSADIYRKNKLKPAKVITSIAMFYDLESPLDFVKDIYDVLEDDGMWVFEQSYLPLMIETNSYDTICHEHVEYYSLEQIDWMFKLVGFKIISAEMNPANGGSFRIYAVKSSSNLSVDHDSIDQLREKERALNSGNLTAYKTFRNSVIAHKKQLLGLLDHLKEEGATILGYGASTKGNVLLQYCGIDSKYLDGIVEINEDKFGKLTPKTHIPIISEAEAHALNPDYYIVLPWHFRDGIVKREADFLVNGGQFIFPLPNIEIVGN